MQVIIPLAGKGTRLRPHTHLVPKPLLKVAGRPVMDWVMDTLAGLDVDRADLHHRPSQGAGGGVRAGALPDPVAVHRAEGAGRHRRRGEPGAAVRARAGAHHLRRYRLRGRSHAHQPHRRRRDHLGEGGRGLPALRRGRDRRAGLHDARSSRSRRSRSPSSPTSVSTTSARWTACGRGSTTCSRRPKNQGEYYLTDAFQWMIEHGKRILTAEVGGWYDCGKLDTLLETNEILLRQGRGAPGRLSPASRSTIRSTSRTASPIERSTIGPNVSLERGHHGRRQRGRATPCSAAMPVAGSELDTAMLGNQVVVEGFRGGATLGDHSRTGADKAPR